ncbi:MAG: RagB/SusD family nutrient uptake outer membrane protein, partial [Bacteroidetes bacterium]|nr:RagB/SusD family nutrient uptake outer membrane protein [Bacteroidota bacterium]
MTNRIIYIFLSAFLLTGCKKYLDIKPKGSLIPTTVADYDHLLDFSNAMEFNFIDNNRGSLLSSLSDNLTITEGQGKIGFVANSHPNVDRWWAYIFRQPYKNPITTDYFWSTGGQGIYTMTNYWNNVIEGINGLGALSPTDQAMANRSVAQALVNRCWLYFNGNFIYGPVYKPGGDNSTKTIPYVTHADFSAPMPDLSTSQEMMTHVMNDLYAALPNLPDASSWPTRANKATAQAMLAYCHLFTQKYDSVLYYSNLAWNASTGGNPGKVLYDYNLWSFSTPASPVTSLITTTQDAYINAVNNREVLFYRGTDILAGIGVALSYPSDEYINLFDQANDLRFKFYLISAPGYKTSAGGGWDDGTRISYYRMSKVRTTEGMSYPEVLLMRAEAYARLNQLSLAVDDLNTLRKYRYKTGTPALTAGTQDQVIAQVLDERRRELPLGGLRRFMDLKRLSLETGKPWSKKTITHTVGTQTYTGTI